MDLKIVFLMSLNIWTSQYITKNLKISKVQPSVVVPIIINEANNNDEFLKFQYKTYNGIIVNIIIYNGNIEFLNLSKEIKGKKSFIYNNKQNQQPFHIFNLINKVAEQSNNFLESSLDEGIYKNSHWKLLEILDENNNKISQSQLNGSNKIIRIKFIKHHNKQDLFRTYILNNGFMEVEETSPIENHYFTIRNHLDLFNKLYVHNNNIDGGKYILKHNGERKNKFTLNNNNNFVNLDKLNVFIKSNEPKNNTFFTLWENKNLFMEVNPVDNNLSFNKSISLKKKNDHWVVEYHNTGVENSIRKIKIIYDINRLDHISKYNNPIINEVFSRGILDNVKLFLINNVRRVMDLTRKYNAMLGLIFLIIIIRILIMLLLIWLERRFGIKKRDNILEIMMSQNGGIHALFVYFIDSFPIILFHSLNKNSSLFLMEPFLWIKDCSWEDPIQLGWRFFTLSPLPILTALAMNLNSKDNPFVVKKGLSYYGQEFFKIMFISFVFRYFSPISCIYFIIYNVINYIQMIFSTHFYKIRKL
jgi:hypothetical protein